MTNAEKLVEVKAELAAVSASILALLGKTRQSVSFGDQSYGLSNVRDLMKVRDELRQREAVLESVNSGSTRRTFKVNFTNA